MLLTLALLVVITALSWPALRGGYDASRLKTVGAEVRAAWIEARNQAMESGELRGFHCVPDGTKYQIFNLEAGQNVSPATQLAGAASSPGAAGSPSTSDSEIQRIPEGYLFRSQDQPNGSSAGMLGAPGNGDQTAMPEDAQWSEPIVFYPDGSTSDAKLMITDKREHSITLFLRGTTGTSWVSDVQSTGEALP